MTTTIDKVGARIMARRDKALWAICAHTSGPSPLYVDGGWISPGGYFLTVRPSWADENMHGTYWPKGLRKGFERSAEPARSLAKLLDLATAPAIDATAWERERIDHETGGALVVLRQPPGEGYLEVAVNAQWFDALMIWPEAVRVLVDERNPRLRPVRFVADGAIIALLMPVRLA